MLDLPINIKWGSSVFCRDTWIWKEKHNKHRMDPEFPAEALQESVAKFLAYIIILSVT